jgi:hypothetical protein
MPRKVGDDPAFPYPLTEAVHKGMSRRQVYAGRALQGLLSNPEIIRGLNFADKAECERFGLMALGFADGLIRAEIMEDTG